MFNNIILKLICPIILICSGARLVVVLNCTTRSRQIPRIFSRLSQTVTRCKLTSPTPKIGMYHNLYSFCIPSFFSCFTYFFTPFCEKNHSQIHMSLGNQTKRRNELPLIHKPHLQFNQREKL